MHRMTPSESAPRVLPVVAQIYTGYYLPALANAMPQEHLPGLSLIIWQQSDPQAHLYFPVSLAVFALPSIA